MEGCVTESTVADGERDVRYTAGGGRGPVSAVLDCSTKSDWAVNAISNCIVFVMVGWPKAWKEDRRPPFTHSVLMNAST